MKKKTKTKHVEVEPPTKTKKLKKKRAERHPVAPSEFQASALERELAELQAGELEDEPAEIAATQVLERIPAPSRIARKSKAPKLITAAEQVEAAAEVAKPQGQDFDCKGTTFAKLGLARWLSEGCEKMGMSYPTPIQVMAIPPALAGKNVAGNAKTGSGKTAAYCLPILHRLSKDPYGVFALILTPVRELAFQVSENLTALGKGIGVQVIEVVGGREMNYQMAMIEERRHIVVATPGRLGELLKGDPNLKTAFRNLSVFVLDEADRLLTQTFEESLADIVPCLPANRQTLLFSATITGSITRLRSKLEKEGKDLMLVDANPNDATLENLTQQYVFVPKIVQVCYIHYLLKEHFPEESCIIFAPTIDMCQLLTTMLEILEFSVTGLHSLQSQRQREACMKKFKGGRCKILVATDVAGRGLDIPMVEVVLNIGLPRATDDYVHRAGRTARAGRPGLVVSLFTEEDVPRVGAIETRIGRKLELLETDETAATKLLTKTTKARQRAELLLSEVGFDDQVEQHRAKKSAQGGYAAKRRKKGEA